MKIADMARHYLRYWYVDADGRSEISGAAPSTVLQFVVSQPKAVDRNMVHAAFVSLANPDNPPADPTPTVALKWFAAHPQAIQHCDEVLGSKRRPKTFNELIVRAYNSAAFAVVDELHNFLLGQLNKQ